MKDMFFAGDIHYNDELCITNVRHKAAIAAALESLKMVMHSIEDGMPEDFFSIDLMDAYEQLGHIIGEAVKMIWWIQFSVISAWENKGVQNGGI